MSHLCSFYCTLANDCSASHVFCYALFLPLNFICSVPCCFFTLFFACFFPFFYVNTLLYSFFNVHIYISVTEGFSYDWRLQKTVIEEMRKIKIKKRTKIKKEINTRIQAIHLFHTLTLHCPSPLKPFHYLDFSYALTTGRP
jgi:hypothetical protein